MKVEEAFQGVGRVFLDSAPVIYYVEARAEFAAIVYPIFRSLGEGEFEGIASPVTLAECLVKPKQLERVDLVQGFTNLLTNTEGIVFVTLGEQVGALAAEMQSRYRLKLPDSLQIATAIVAHCDVFLTNDAQLRRVKELRVAVASELEA
jgi:predicted nucleic acid-binding protein